jgi:hypothetical protein
MSDTCIVWKGLGSRATKDTKYIVQTEFRQTPTERVRHTDTHHTKHQPTVRHQDAAVPDQPSRAQRIRLPTRLSPAGLHRRQPWLHTSTLSIDRLTQLVLACHCTVWKQIYLVHTFIWGTAFGSVVDNFCVVQYMYIRIGPTDNTPVTSRGLSDTQRRQRDADMLIHHGLTKNGVGQPP